MSDDKRRIGGHVLALIVALVAGLTAFIAAVATYALLGPYGLIGLATVAVFVLIIQFVIAATADNPTRGLG